MRPQRDEAVERGRGRQLPADPLFTSRRRDLTVMTQMVAFECVAVIHRLSTGKSQILRTETVLHWGVAGVPGLAVRSSLCTPAPKGDKLVLPNRFEGTVVQPVRGHLLVFQPQLVVDLSVGVMLDSSKAVYKPEF